MVFLLPSTKRYTWKHDSVLAKIVNDLKGAVSSSIKIFADLDKTSAEFNPPATVPLHILATSLRPDIVIMVKNDIFLLELIIPTNSPHSLSQA